MAKDLFTKKWIIENAESICRNYADGVLTLRSLHYQLVGIGMTNDIQHYKRVVNAMIDARWDGVISFEQFSDLDRSMIGETMYERTDVHDQIEVGKRQVELWMRNYSKNKWENQPIYHEVLIEKKALQGVFEPVCSKLGVTLGACKGYPSLTFLHEMSQRMKRVEMEGKKIVVIYFGDYDPSGDDIPRSIVENLKRFGVEDVELRRVALNDSQVKLWRLPHAPAKITDSRSKTWSGIGQVELDAVKPEKLQSMCTEAIQGCFDYDLYTDLVAEEQEEREIYIKSLRDHVNNLK